MITSADRFSGHILASSPAMFQEDIQQQVILLISHTSQLAIGVQINHEAMGQSLQAIGKRMGIDIPGSDPIWNGGTLGRDKIHIIHSTDWMGSSSVRITDDIAVTNEVSILLAMSQNEGPKYYKACSGFYSWSHDELMHSLGVKSASVKIYQTAWEIVPASTDLIFLDRGGDQQWLKTLEASATYQSTRWF